MDFDANLLDLYRMIMKHCQATDHVDTSAKRYPSLVSK